MKASAYRQIRIVRLDLCLLVLAACLALGARDAQAAGPCANEAIREAQVSDALPEGSTFLPDCMALELVSPAKKFNQYVFAPDFSATGERLRFFSLAALADTPKQGSLFDPYIATRTQSGWLTEATAAPPEILLGTAEYVYPCSYTAELSRWALWGSTEAQAEVYITTPFQGALGGFFAPLGPTMAPLNDIEPPSLNPLIFGRCEGASADLSHFLFSIPNGISYLPGDPAASPDNNVYEAYLDQGAPTVALLQRDKDGVVHGNSCGASVGFREGNNGFQRGSVSPDASRVYFTTRPEQPASGFCNSAGYARRIMLRNQTPAGPEIAELISNECTRVAPTCSSANGDDTYLGASQEGGKVYFTTTRQLTDSDQDLTVDLYLYDTSLPAGGRLTQASAGDNTAPTPGEGAEFLGLADFSGDGSRAYFVAKGVLTTVANEEGDNAQAGERNLYLYQRDAEYPAGRTIFIATLAATDSFVWNSTPGENNDAKAVPRLGADPEDQAVGGDGRILVFDSSNSLSADDTDSGESDIYRYDSDTGEILRVSAADPLGQDNGPFAASRPSDFSLYPGPQAVPFSSWASEDGNTIVFTTEEALDPGDQNTADNGYIWKEGALTVLPSPQFAGASNPVVSMSGEKVAFVTDDRLLPEDLDGAKDIYVANAGGGYPIPIPPVICAGEDCQGPPSSQPQDQGAASVAPRQGNPPKRATCRKGQARKRGRCVKRQKRQRKQQSKGNRKQGGRK